MWLHCPAGTNGDVSVTDVQVTHDAVGSDTDAGLEGDTGKNRRSRPVPVPQKYSCHIPIT